MKKLKLKPFNFTKEEKTEIKRLLRGYNVQGVNTSKLTLITMMKIIMVQFGNQSSINRLITMTSKPEWIIWGLSQML